MSVGARLRFRVDFAPQCSVGIGKIQLLEKIASHGSLTQAAREMRMSYRRAWLLLKDLNQGFDRPVTEASVGGRGGGGVTVTPFGQRLIAAYRHLEEDMQPIVDKHLKAMARRVPAARKRA